MQNTFAADLPTRYDSAALFSTMNHPIPSSPVSLVLVSLLAPVLAHAHPGHGAGDGISHDFAHVALGFAALLLTAGLVYAARKLKSRQDARSIVRERSATNPSAPGSAEPESVRGSSGE